MYSLVVKQQEKQTIGKLEINILKMNTFVCMYVFTTVDGCFGKCW